jgi:DNA mismatch endonuclease (patch repair protein)
MDRLSKEQRHKNMAAIHSSGTKPEMIVRHYLFSHGFRYRVNSHRLPGKPDIVLTMFRTAIFVNGCFWHGHEGCKYFRLPKTNVEFWKGKIERNRKRDAERQEQVARMGWHVLTVWECELRPKERLKTLQSLEYTLNLLFMRDHDSRRVEPIKPENELPLAAEPESVPYGKKKTK